MMEQLLALARKAAEVAEVYFVSSEETDVRFEANRLKQLQAKQQTGVALRVVGQGRIGYATATSLDDRQALVNAALETARFGQEAKFELPGKIPYPKVDAFDPAVDKIGNEVMIGLGQEMIDIVTAHTPGILCEAGVGRANMTFRLANSSGGKAEYRKTYFSLGVEGTLIQGTDMLFVGESESSCRPLDTSKQVAAVVTRQLDLAKERASAATKNMPVVFTPDGVAGALLSPLMAAFNGKTVLEGASPVGKKLGQVAFDTRLSIWDDPTLPYRPRSRPCDDEGMPSQRTPIIENGRVASFIYDLQTAAKAKARSTGSARRNGGLPSPGPTAFVISPGNVTFDDMVRDIKEGLVIEQLMGAEQGNILGGDFSGNVLLGYKIEGGRLVGRVKNTMVSGNVYQLLKDIGAIGKEARWIGGFVQTPHLLFNSVSVASKD